MKTTIFLTGGTGLIGGNIIVQLLKRYPALKLFLLVRGQTKEEAETRLWSTLTTIDPEISPENIAHRVEFMLGDVAIPNLGMSPEDLRKVVSESTHILHCAASVEFNLHLSDARKTNYEGTKHMLAVAKEARKTGCLEKFAYVSTAYVSGRRQGTVYESELDHSTGFANSYEQSKYEAEQLVRASGNEIPFLILRPSIVVGDSQTGITTSFNVLYIPLRFILNGLVTTFPGSPETPLDVIPVDFLAEAACHIMIRAENVVGKTFHLTAGPGNASTTGEVVSLAVKQFNRSLKGRKAQNVRFVPGMNFDLKSPLPGGTIAPRLIAGYESYVSGKRIFDTTNTMCALTGTGICPPSFRLYHESVFRYFIQSLRSKELRRAA